MFSEEFVKYTEEKYAARLPLFGELSKEIERTFETLNQGEIKYRKTEKSYSPASRRGIVAYRNFINSILSFNNLLFSNSSLKHPFIPNQ